ncbi:MAG TPA: alkaline phosphatase D family protein [archaeon]|nr:alkaline phosphatase D family protein [archaeon]
MRVRAALNVSICLILLSASAARFAAAQLTENSPPIENWDYIRLMRWVGPNLWANRLADWEVREGYLRPTNGDPACPVRTVHAITREVLPETGSFTLSVDLSSEVPVPSACRAGFLIGAGAGLLDWRAAALVHSNSGKGGGILAFLELGPTAKLTFRDMSGEFKAREYPELAGVPIKKEIVFAHGTELSLRLEVGPGSSKGTYDLRLVLFNAANGERLAQLVLPGRPGREVMGSFAIAFSSLEQVGYPAVRFRNFRVWGDKLRARPERAFGPVMGTLYTMAGGVLKMTAQFAPVAYQGNPEERYPAPLKAYLEIKTGDSSGNSIWAIADSARITMPDYTAQFRVEGWKSETEQAFRVVYHGEDGKTWYYEGTIAREPGFGEIFSLAAFTGMGVMGRTADSGPAPSDKGPVVGRWTPANVWFPFAETVDNLSKFKVDLLCFTGDQIYEGKPTAPEQSDRFPVLDYLYKWYLWHWAFGELTRRRPAVCQVDDHDIYQGNVWGWGGRLNMTGENWLGGYMRDPLFVRLVERTQCAHNPDPYDPAPVLNDIGVYYTGFSYGGVSFALLEDRKFKSSRYTDESEACLLGQRQLEFLEEWAKDWRKAAMKVVLSQGSYASVQTDREGSVTRDTDTGGWPKRGRDRALEAFRKARAMIVCGDQHLSTLVSMGLDAFSDGPVQFCVPALGNIFWRWFYPKDQGSGPLADPQGCTGEFTDGFGNRFCLLAAANPTDVQFMGDRDQTLRKWNSRPEVNVDSVRLCQGDGVGIVRIDKKAGTYLIECWPYNVPPDREGGGQFKGWPVTFTQEQMDLREPVGFLARVEFPAQTRVCAAVYDESGGSLIYAFPLRSSGEALPAYKEGKYSLVLYDPDNPAARKEYPGLTVKRDPGSAPLLKFGD